MIWSPGKVLKGGRYTIEEVLRQGRLSTTYLAQSSKGKVVIKATNNAAMDPADFQQLRQRFSDEAFRLQRCQSQYIVKVQEPFEADGMFCIPMEFIAGTTLDKRHPAKLSEGEALRYVRQVGEALGVMHGQKLLHRDVTPKNIMLRSRDGVNEAVLIDFGLVRDWTSGTRMTMMASDITAFTAPELCDPDESRGDYTDLYALGAVLYAFVTGDNPPKAVSRRPEDSLPFPIGVNPQIAAAIEKAMKLESVDRPPTVAEWLKVLPDIPLTTLTQPIAPSVSAQPEARRKRMIEVIGLVALILGTIFAGFQGVAALLTYLDTRKSPPQSAPSPPALQPTSPK
jgi:eukaryotic-like serine/threonine-protein kinase